MRSLGERTQYHRTRERLATLATLAALTVRISRLVGRMGLNYESKTATQSSEDKNRQNE